MTRDQMHNTLRYVREQLADERGTDYSGVEALDMVLEELEQEPTIGQLFSCEEVEELRKKIWKQVEQEPSGDLISRQEVIDACEQSINILEAVDRIMDLPSVEQEPKRGQGMTPYIKDLQSGNIRPYGSNHHDSLMISQDGTYLTYEHLQCGDGSIAGDKEHSGFVFCDSEGHTPEEDETLCRYGADAYFNIGGWGNPIDVLDKISAEIDEQIKYNTYFNSDMAKGEIIAFEWVKRKIDEYTKGESL